MLSRLQKFILKQCWKKHGKVLVKTFLAFYKEDARKNNVEQRYKAIRKSIDRLIKKEFLTGYGSKTPHKLYIKEVRLTAKGRKTARELLPKQLTMISVIKK